MQRLWGVKHSSPDMPAHQLEMQHVLSWIVFQKDRCLNLGQSKGSNTLINLHQSCQTKPATLSSRWILCIKSFRDEIRTKPDKSCPDIPCHCQSYRWVHPEGQVIVVKQAWGRSQKSQNKKKLKFTLGKKNFENFCFYSIFSWSACHTDLDCIKDSEATGHDHRSKSQIMIMGIWANIWWLLSVYEFRLYQKSLQVESMTHTPD